MNKLSISVLLFFSSCAGITSMDVPFEKPSLVVNSYFSEDEKWQVNLSQSHHILDVADPAYVNNASVQISGSDGSFFYLYYDSLENGNYINDSITPKANVTYTIEAFAPNYEAVSASDYAPSKADIINEKLDTIIPTLNNPADHKLTFTINDNPNEENYYVFFMAIPYFYWGEEESDTFLHIGFISNDPIMEYEVKYSYSDFLSTSQINYVERVFFSDELFNGSSRIFEFYPEEYFSYYEVDNLFFYILSVSKTYYLYEISAYKQIDTKNNIMAEPVKVYNNIEGGMGIFAGYSTVLDTVEVP
jgi:hypothetical protein